MVRLLLRPHGRHGQFAAYLGCELICTSRQPLLDGARELARRGYDPTLALTTRHEGKGYDNFIPKLLAELADLTVDDDNRRFRKFRPWKSAGSVRDAQVDEGGDETTTKPAAASGATCGAAEGAGLPA
jgi:hypothetical protein